MGKRLLALDLGEVRVGVALSDLLGITAQPLETIRRVGPRKDLRLIEDVVRANDVGTVIVGLPLLLSGEEGEKALEAKAFAEHLRRRLQNVDVRLWDERLTTLEAERAMISGSVRREKRKKKVDALAAVLILQSYLDTLGSGGIEAGGAE